MKATSAEGPETPERTATTLRLLSRAWGRLGGSRRGRAILALAGARAVGRTWVRWRLLRDALLLPGDVTVLIGIRNRTDHRIVNALRSVREQVYPGGRVDLLVVDYGSDVAEARRLSDICTRFGAELITLGGVTRWSRSRCLNVGLRRVRTRWVMTSDADIVLSPHYLADAAAALRARPLSIVCSAMLDLPEESVEAGRHAGECGSPADLLRWRPRCSVRLGRDLHPSIGVTFTAFHRAIRGYDEYYEGWGREDEDLMRRFVSLGLRPVAIPDRSFYLHQWHPKFEGVAGDERARLVDHNNRHFAETRTILRNDRNWGRVALKRRTSADGASGGT